MKLFFSIIFFLVISLTGIAQQNWDSIRVTSRNVKGNIYILQGSGGNIGVLTGKDGIVMVDDQFLQLGTKIKNLKKPDRKPTLEEVVKIFKKYKGWEAYATLYLWKSL